MQLPLKSVLASFGTVSLAAALVSFAIIAAQPELPHPDKILAVDAHVGVEGCVIEKWLIPYKYPTINHYLQDYPEATPFHVNALWCEIKGLPTDIQSNETFDDYNSRTFDYPVIVN